MYAGYQFLIAVTIIGQIYGGQECLSCYGIPDPFRCRQTVHCHIDEVCFMHNYTTDKNVNLYDLGCTYPDLCPGGNQKRADEGHHIVCHSCCNHTNICNMDLSCSHETGGGTITSAPHSCAEMDHTTSGVYTIYPNGPFHAVKAYCMMDNNERWTVIQRRSSGTQDFYKGWKDYRNGFGSAFTEYWLGNENIHLISRTSAHEMAVYLEDFAGEHRWANYSFVHIGDEKNNYRFYASGYTGNAGDTLTYANGMPFSTFDREHNSKNCSEVHRGGWWYSTCGYSNLNGAYLGAQSNNSSGMFWYAWHGFTYSFKTTTIMIRKK